MPAKQHAASVGIISSSAVTATTPCATPRIASASALNQRRVRHADAAAASLGMGGRAASSPQHAAVAAAVAAAQRLPSSANDSTG